MSKMSKTFTSGYTDTPALKYVSCKQTSTYNIQITPEVISSYPVCKGICLILLVC